MKRFVTVTLCLLILLGMTMPFSAYAQEGEQKVVRVGWYESTYC